MDTDAFAYGIENNSMADDADVERHSSIGHLPRTTEVGTQRRVGHTNFATYNSCNTHITNINNSNNKTFFIMKKTIIALMAIFALSAANCQAQGLFDALKKLSGNNNTEQSDSKSSSNTASNLLGGLGDIVSGLLGMDKVSENSIVGTWSYNVPAVVFESENILTNVGGSAASKAIEQKLQNYLNKVGFTSGKVKITFNEDKSGSILFANKNIPFQWSVADTDLTINLASTAFSQLTSSTKLGKFTTFKVNCKMTSDGMQLAFKADKLAQFLSKVLSAVGSATNNTTLTTLTAATKSINGMYLGLTFVK